MSVGIHQLVNPEAAGSLLPVPLGEDDPFRIEGHKNSCITAKTFFHFSFIFCLHCLSHPFHYTKVKHLWGIGRKPINFRK
jgi:hypothetical protein